MEKIIVVGAGQAGQALVTKLRALGFEGQITIIGDEPVPPYQRPPLSKKYLTGEMDVERLFLRPQAYYQENGIALMLGEPVTAIDLGHKTITVGTKVLTYDKLAITTGSVPRKLPQNVSNNLNGVFSVRTLADVDSMAPEFQMGRHLLVVGGGYIGLEAAAVAAQKGLKVTLIEVAPRILQRTASAETADFIRAKHSREGVEIREGVGLEALIGDGQVANARLTDGTVISVDFAIVGVGISPATKIAELAGLELNNGIMANEFGQTSDPSIWTAGDCASFPYNNKRIRLESVGNAIDQAENVAENMLGANKPYLARPWFWSDQYDIKLQIAGLNTGYDHIVSRAGANNDTISMWYYQQEKLLAVDAMNSPRAYMVGKRLIEMGKSPCSKLVADPGVDLKFLLKDG